MSHRKPSSSGKTGGRCSSDTAATCEALRWIIVGSGLGFALLVLSEFYRAGWSGFAFAVLCSVMWGLIWAVYRYIEQDHAQSAARLEAQVPDP